MRSMLPAIRQTSNPVPEYGILRLGAADFAAGVALETLASLWKADDIYEADDIYKADDVYAGAVAAGERLRSHANPSTVMT